MSGRKAKKKNPSSVFSDSELKTMRELTKLNALTTAKCIELDLN